MDKPLMKCFTVLSHTALNNVSVKSSYTFRWQQHATPSHRERHNLINVWSNAMSEKQKGTVRAHYFFDSLIFLMSSSKSLLLVIGCLSIEVEKMFNKKENLLQN